MEADNKVSNGEAGGRRKSFLEKLGLVEPIEEDAQGVSSGVDEAKVPQSPASINSLFSNELEKKADLVPKPESDKPAAPSQPVIAEKPMPVFPTASVQPEPTPTPAFSAAHTPDDSLSKSGDYRSAVASQKSIQMLTISEIYTLFNLKPVSERETVYLIENLLQALPVNLPLEVKKDSLQKLLRASSFDAGALASDGKERIETLKRYLDSFTQDLEDVIAHNEMQVADLKEKIRQHTDIIAEKTRMISEQKSLVRFESHRISALLDSLEKGK